MSFEFEKTRYINMTVVEFRNAIADPLVTK